jgi:3',5'-cyclic AMP phosphodiesterase CpdA
MRLLLPILLFFLFAVSQQPAAPLAFYVEPYLQLPAPDGMTIMWETTLPTPSRVEYGPTEQLGLVKVDRAPVKLHQVRLEGLQAGTAYYYRVHSDSLVSQIHRFRTAPVPGTPQWRLAVYGDSRSNPAMHRRVVEQIVKQNVDLILHTGDIVLNGKNYASWRKEFFEPIAPLASSVPWVTTIGNHEQDAANYFSYAALPGNERHFGFDFGNAHFVCLDSNAWIPRTPGSPQYRWAQAHLQQPRTTTWKFVYFHHPLFSAHPRRAINPLRWDWAPLFLDPASQVDGVLNGHDHFYARNYRIAKMTPKPHPVFTLTTAGGAAALYPVMQRDYVATAISAHHFTLLEFDGPKINLTAIDVQGKVIDRHTLTKATPPGEEICAYEVEELREQLRLALRQLPAVEVTPGKPTVIRQEILLPAHFGIPVAGTLHWQIPEGWQMPGTEIPFTLQPGEPLHIPLQATVSPEALGRRPRLLIEFQPGKFRNRFLETLPFKLTAASQVADGTYALLPTNGSSTIPLPQVQLKFSDNQLSLQAVLPDPEGKVKVSESGEVTPSSRLARMGEHLRLEILLGKDQHSLALSPDQRTHALFTGMLPPWRATATKGNKAWHGTITVPLPPGFDRTIFRCNVVYFHEASKEWFELRPTFAADPKASPEEIPLWEPSNDPSRFARLQ